MEHKYKFPVSVIALFVGEGFDTIPRVPASPGLMARHKIIPLRILTGDNEKIIIDRVTDINRQASTKAGGLGDRYTCLASFGEVQREFYLYKDDNEWYMEGNY